MRIGIAGTGSMARALGARWTAAGHDVRVAGRSRARTREIAATLGARAVDPADVATMADAVLLAVPASAAVAVVDTIRAVEHTVLIDVTNPVRHGTGELLHEHGSVARRLGELRPGVRVVKGFNLLPADVWTALPMPSPPPAVPLAGADDDALRVASTLVRDAGGVPVVLGGPARARQLEEAAGFVIALAFAGVDPRSALPGPV